MLHCLIIILRKNSYHVLYDKQTNKNMARSPSNYIIAKYHYLISKKLELTPAGMNICPKFSSAKKKYIDTICFSLAQLQD